MPTYRLGMPSPSANPKQHREFLRTTKEALEVAQRQRGDPKQSFVRLDEMVTAGVADVNGNIVPIAKAAKRVRRLAIFRGT